MHTSIFISPAADLILSSLAVRFPITMATIDLNMCVDKAVRAVKDVFKDTPIEARVLVSYENADAEDREKFEAEFAALPDWLKGDGEVNQPAPTCHGQAFELDNDSPGAEAALDNYCKNLAQNTRMLVELKDKTRVGVALYFSGHSQLHVTAKVYMW